jgi:hypothetical protein
LEGSDADYQRHMKKWCRYLKSVLDDGQNPEVAAKLRVTLEKEYANAIADFDRQQIGGCWVSEGAVDGAGSQTLRILKILGDQKAPVAVQC